MQAIYNYLEPDITRKANKAVIDSLVYGIEPKYTNYKKGKL